MFDACVDYKISNDIKKRLKIHVGNGVVITSLKKCEGICFFKPKNRDVLKEAVDRMIPFGIIDSELIFPKDSPHYPKSGIDDTIARIMSKKKIAIVFDLSLILKSSGEKRGKILYRMKENMRKAVKYDIPVLFASLAKNDYELFNGSQIKAIANYLGIDNFKRVKKSFNKIFGDEK